MAQNVVSFESDGRLETFFRDLTGSPEVLEKQGAQAASDASRRTRTHVVRKTTEILAIRQASVRDRVKERIGASRLERKLVFEERNGGFQAPALSSFNYTQLTRAGRIERKAAGISVKVRKDRRREKWRYAFIGKNPNAAKQLIFKRDRKRGVNPRTGKQYLKVLRAPSVVGLMRDRPGFSEEIETFWSEQLEEQMTKRAERRARRLASNG